MKYWILLSLSLLMLCLTSGVVSAQNYVGDQACAGCHANFPEDDFFDGYMRSGHPWKLFHNEGLEPGTETPPKMIWPGTPVPPLPMAFGNQLEWSDVEYVIGNYFWKARFVDLDGYIWTGNASDSTQWNIETQEFVPYHPGETIPGEGGKPFNCGKCHTTGYQPEGNQLGLPGLIGTWTEEGVRCEACHGPGSEHAADPFGVSPPGGKDCSECHFRDADFRMPWKGGFMRHHQQSEDLSHSPHDFYDCVECHNPHRSVVYKDGGTIKHCSDCHPGDADNDFYVVQGMEDVDCKECHMPYMGKSAVALNEFTGDIRGHLFRITTEAIFAADNVYDAGGSLFWNQDLEGQSSVTLDYACLGCHLDKGDDLTLEQAAAFARNIHNPVANEPPVADPNGPYTGVVGEAVQFDGSGSFDPEGETLTYVWSFGDETFPPQLDPERFEENPLHVYEAPGTYTVTLFVSDGELDAQATTTVEITETGGGGDGDWTVRVPFLGIEFQLSIEEFAGILMMEEIFPDGSIFAIGMESNGVIFWYDVNGAMFYGMVNHDTGIMQGIVFNLFGGSSIFFAEK